jgi:hypothetical protein
MTIDQLFKLARDAKLADEPFLVTASGLMKARAEVIKWNIPADHFMMSATLTKLFFPENWFVDAMEPAASREEVDQGMIGTFYGMKVFVDTQGRLEPDTVAVVSKRGCTEGVLGERCVYKAKVQTA